MTVEPILEMGGICKSFPGVQALDHVDLTVQRGEVHAIVGENGAGKSTLMKILAGAYIRDEGVILLKGSPVEIHNPLEAQALGIAIIYQEFNLAPHLSAAANIFIGREPRMRFLGFIKRRKIHEDARRLFEQLGADINPTEEVRRLSVCCQQITEIARALSMASSVLIMDEPTSALPEAEVQTLFNVIRRLRSKGATVLYISHNLDEVFEIADTITVLRDGKRIGTRPAADLGREQVVHMMVGRTIEETKRRESLQFGDEVLRVEGLCRDDVLQDISFSLHQGEILGIAGLLGSGRTELLRCLFGADQKTAGKVYVDGHPCNIRHPIDGVRAGMGFMPEDRKQQGLFLGLATRENVTAASLATVARFGLINRLAEREMVDRYIKSLDIRVASQEQKAVNLSGGNQQKVVLARWLALRPKVLLLDDPTRGIDVGARAAIHDLIVSLADQGVSIVFVSSELPEVLKISDRILAIADGQIMGEFTRAEATQEKIMLCATGAASHS
jgi:ABC-type sugar transport system ATPase subunit